MPIFDSRRAPNRPWSKTNFLPKFTGFNVGTSTKPKLTSLQSPRPTTDDDCPHGTMTQWQWSCPIGHPPTPPSHCNLGHLRSIPTTHLLRRQRTTKRRHRRRFLPSAHRRCLRRIRQQTTRNPTAIHHFAMRIKRHDKSWVL